MPITHVLLDIEGTTCPVSFVADVLFPYAREALATYIASHSAEPEVGDLLASVEQTWAADPSPEAQQLRIQCSASSAAPLGQGVVPYLHHLIDHDVKLTALKDLQGRIWEAGYASGSIVAPLFSDVPAALMQWYRQGLVLAVYSSGSVPAQKLLYGHCQAGDLRPLFSHWFDTRTGAKQDASSYRVIAEQMHVPPGRVLFISDSLLELQAADAAGMPVLFSDREGNPGKESGPFERISDYSTLDPSDVTERV